MRVVVYHEPWGGSLGGAEVVSATIAHALRDRGEVTLLHHNPALTASTPAALAAFAGVDLDGVMVKAVPAPTVKWFPAEAPVWRLSQHMRHWLAEVSTGADLFVASVHGVPPFCHAKTGGLYVHFPTFDRRAAWPWNVPPAGGWRGLKEQLRRGLHERLWRDRMDSYAVKRANSRFTAEWTEQYWGGTWGVLHPPIRTDFPDRPKRDAVVVLGRFTRRKQQLDAMRVFRDRVAPHAPGWELLCIGSVGQHPDDQDYFREVQAEATGPVRLLVNAPTEQVREELAGAKVFWHTAGLGLPANADPYAFEHFGMATAEAMAAGCVPVVANCGGQPEIVQPGDCGYLCNHLDELAEHTLRLAGDESLRLRLSAAARLHAAAFSRERFIREVRQTYGGEEPHA